MNLLQRSSFLSRNALLDLYFKIILPSVSYELVVWGGCPNVDLLNSLEILHHGACAASQGNIQLAPRHAYWWSMPTFEIKWNTLAFYYKHNVFIGEAPAALSAVSTHFTGQCTDFYRKVKKDFYFKELDFSAQSVQSLPQELLRF